MRTALLTCLLLSLTVLPSGAAEVTLAEALRAAVTNRPLAREARARAAEAEAAVGEARSAWLPKVTVSELFTRTAEPAGNLFIALNQGRDVMGTPGYDFSDPAPRSDFETRLQLDQTLYDPAVDYTLRQARSTALGAAAGAAWSAEEAAFAAYRAYLGVQQAAAAVEATAANRRECEEIARLAGERRQAGIGLKADELRAGVQLAEARRRELAAANDLTLARRRLALATGAVDREVDIAAPLDEAQLPEARESAIAGRADLAALEHQRATAALAVAGSRAAWLPSLQLSARQSWHAEDGPSGADDQSWTVGAGLRWELFDGLRRGAASARARAGEEAAEARLAEEQRAARLKLDEARLRADEAALQLASARQAVSAAEESQRLLGQRYEAGLADLADLLATQNALAAARADAVGAAALRLLSLGNVAFQGGRFLATYLPGEELHP